MTLPSNGSINMYQVAVELGISHVSLNLGHTQVRALAGKPSGSISFADLHAKSATQGISIGTGTTSDNGVDYAAWGWSEWSFGPGWEIIGFGANPIRSTAIGDITGIFWVRVYDWNNYEDRFTVCVTTSSPITRPFRLVVGTQAFNMPPVQWPDVNGIYTSEVGTHAITFDYLPRSGTVDFSITV
jgi:hypothetical protein